MQRVSGANAGFGGYPDEPSHYLSGLMIHDYLKAGMPRTPLAYASAYYAHVPCMAIGYWPPLFYVVLTFWMFCAGITRGAALLLIATITAALASFVQRQASSRFGWWTGVLSGLVFLTVPCVQWSNNLVMTDTFVALCGLLAAVGCGEYLETGRLWPAIKLAIWSAAAILVKLSGAWVLVLLPAGILLTRKFYLLRRGATWLSYGLALGLCGPWLWVTRHLLTKGQVLNPTPVAHFVEVFPALSLMAFLGVGAALSLVAVLGWVTDVAAIRRLPPTWVILLIQPGAALANVAATGLQPEPRYTVPCIPVLVLCLASGIWWLARWVPGSWRREWKAAAGMLMCLGLAVFHAGLVKAAPDDFSGMIASAIAADPHLRGDAALVAPANGAGGSIIAELALRAAHRPDGLTLVRANKALAASGWNGENYTLLLQSASEVQRFLEENCIPVVITQESRTHTPHYDLLLQTLRQYPDRWQEIGEFGGPGRICRLYHLRDHQACAPGAWLKRVTHGMPDGFHGRPPGL
jgi:4-amino-4-deoxy-L-arabinose transferase-like glycosyltransferase